jgi:NAD(P)-dependent dehydrogenase (short-subunit alcohol dehydrogenase family)
VDGIAGSVAIITGGASGLGAGLARRFVLEGARVCIADVQYEAGHRLAADLGKNALFQPTDLRIDAQLDALLERTHARFGQVDFLLNVACSYAEDGLRSSREAWQCVFDINLFGHALLIQKAVPYLSAAKNPSVVNLSSASGHIAQMGRWVYPASKAAIEQMTRSAALELAQCGIRVNALLPGMVAKEGQQPPDVTERLTAMAQRSNMLGRLQDPDEVAQAALFLCSTHARFITGSCLVADGGYTALGPLGREVHIPKRNPDAAGGP